MPRRATSDGSRAASIYSGPVASPATLFVAYSHADEALRGELDRHLAGMQRRGLICAWSDRCIEAGDDWRRQIHGAIEAAHVFLLLVSSDFLASDYCYDVEMTAAIRRTEAGLARLIPVIVRDCDWEGAPFARFQVLPGGAVPVTSWRNRDEAWANVARGVAAALQGAGESSRPPVSEDVAGDSTKTPGGAPVYRDTTTRHLAEQLERARRRQRSLRLANAPTADVDREILDLRRALREGGALTAGDDLHDGRYLLLESIGRGGFASVWKALDRETGQFVAIKVLHNYLAPAPTSRARFFRGARVMMSLSGAAVVRIIEPQGEESGYCYFVMEYAPGGDLRKLVLSGAPPNCCMIPSRRGHRRTCTGWR